MNEAIKLLKQELDWSAKNKEQCPHSSEWHAAYCEGIRAAIGILAMAQKELDSLKQMACQNYEKEGDNG